MSIAEQISQASAPECETAVLGSVLFKNDRYWACKEIGLTAEAFSSELHQRLWTAIEEWVKAGQSANPVTLARRFKDDPDMQGLGGPAYLSKMVTGTVGLTGARPEDFARVVIEWSQRRKLAELAGEIEGLALDTAKSPAETMEMIDRTLNDCRITTGKGGLVPMAQVMEAAMASIERAHKRGRVEGIETGLKAIDVALGGLANTDLIVLAGRPGMGKSALAGTIADYVARDHASALFSLEMSAEQFASRILSGEAGVDSTRLRRGNIGSEEMHRVINAGRIAGKIQLFIDDTPQIRPADIRARLKQISRVTPIKLVVVDYIQLMRGDDRRRDYNRVLEIGEITGSLKAMAKEFNCPFLALSQLSRKVEERDDKRPQLADLRDSGSIEQDADQVWFLYRDEYYAKREEPPIGAHAEKINRWHERITAAAGKAELIIAKNRHGPDQTVTLAFQGQYARFANLEN